MGWFGGGLGLVFWFFVCLSVWGGGVGFVLGVLGGGVGFVWSFFAFGFCLFVFVFCFCFLSRKGGSFLSFCGCV